MGFDRWFNKNHAVKTAYSDLYIVGARKGFEAGAVSRQAEIDKLKQALNSALQANENVCLERDDLQKRIDKALIEINIYYDSDGMEDICLCDVDDILKGKKDE